MTKDNELLPCPFCGGDCYINHVWNRNEGVTSFGVNCTRCSADKRGFDNKDDAIDFWNTRAAQPQPPVIEGLQEAIKEVDAERSNDWMGRQRDLERVLEAARLYAQGQTAQHVDLDALKKGLAKESSQAYRNKGWNDCLEAVKDHLATRGMIVTAQEGFDKLVEMLDRDPQHKPRLAALLREHSVIEKQPTEAAQGALFVLSTHIGPDDSLGQKCLETIRAALARGLGE